MKSNTNAVIIAPIDEIEVKVVAEAGRLEDLIWLVFDVSTDFFLLHWIYLDISNIFKIRHILFIFFLLREA